MKLPVLPSLTSENNAYAIFSSVAFADIPTDIPVSQAVQLLAELLAGASSAASWLSTENMAPTNTERLRLIHRSRSVRERRQRIMWRTPRHDLQLVKAEVTD